MYQTREEVRSWASVPTPAELPDEHLVRMAKRDPATFVHLYDRYVEDVYRYCARRLAVAAAEDATSITFLNALKAIARFDPDRAPFRAWLFTIAHNAVNDQVRARSHEPIDALEIQDRAKSLDDHVIALDRRDALDRAISQLPPDQQQVVHLRMASLTGVEIALATGRSHAAVRALQHRALKRLRSLLQQTHQERDANA